MICVCPSTGCMPPPPPPHWWPAQSPAGSINKQLQKFKTQLELSWHPLAQRKQWRKRSLKVRKVILFSRFIHLSLISRCDSKQYLFYLLDMKSFECSSPSELDRKFFGEHSLLSALSLEQLSTSRTSNDAEADGSDTRLSVLASLCLSSDPISPSQAFPMGSVNSQDTDNCYLAVPLQGKSSTPQILLQKQQKKAACFDQLYSDVAASQMSWDVSLIKPESNSPKPYMESSGLEQTWSPKPPSTQYSLAEVSPWRGRLSFKHLHPHKLTGLEFFSCTWLSASAPTMHQGWLKVDFKMFCVYVKVRCSAYLTFLIIVSTFKIHVLALCVCFYRIHVWRLMQRFFFFFKSCEYLNKTELYLLKCIFTILFTKYNRKI